MGHFFYFRSRQMYRKRNNVYNPFYEYSLSFRVTPDSDKRLAMLSQEH